MLDHDFINYVFLEKYRKHAFIFTTRRPQTLCDRVLVWFDDAASAGLGI